MMLEARLTIEGSPRPVSISGPGPWLLGRAVEADIPFPEDRSCSREQARIIRTDDGFAIQPLSRNSQTAIDGEPIAGTEPLPDGARITFGVQRLLFTLIETEFAEA
ncbi:MAG TPA: FHA domain-containing protein, partial [Rhodopila sp.]